MGNSSSSAASAQKRGSSGMAGSRRSVARSRRGLHRRKSPELTIDDFSCVKGFPSNIGEGGFGRVLAMVRRDDPMRRFAVKCMNKAKILHRKQVDNVLNELGILRRLDHYPYLVNLFYAFQDRNNVYMCTDLMLGGTLQRALRKSPNGNFSDEPDRIRLYAAELSLALQFLHANNVVHRDIKPDNVLLDANGHVHITDFNVSIYVEPGQEESQKHNDGWGTRGYRAPEVYLRTGAGFIFACDWWSLGSMIYEMYTGRVPYTRQHKDEQSSDLLLRMNAENADFYQIESEITRDFLRKMLRFDPELRLGCQHGSNSEVMILAHPFFNGTDWDSLEKYSNPNDVERATSEGSRTTDNSDHIEAPNSVAGTETMSTVLGGQNLPSHAGTAAIMDAPASGKPTFTEGKSVRASGPRDIREYMDNFDHSLDQKEKLRILQRNMGILGLNGFENIEDDENQFPALTPEQQQLFKDWQFNVDFKLEQLQMPQFTLLQTVSSMSPLEIKSWVGTSKPESIRALCSEMKSYREQAMKENFDHVMAEMRIDRLIEENLRLTRRIAQLEQRAGIRQTQDDPLNDTELGFQPTSLTRKSSRSSRASMAAAEIGVSVPDSHYPPTERQRSMGSTGAASTTSAVPVSAVRPVSNAYPVSPVSAFNNQQQQMQQQQQDATPTAESSVVLFHAGSDGDANSDDDDIDDIDKNEAMPPIPPKSAAALQRSRESQGLEPDDEKDYEGNEDAENTSPQPFPVSSTPGRSPMKQAVADAKVSLRSKNGVGEDDDDATFFEDPNHFIDVSSSGNKKNNTLKQPLPTALKKKPVSVNSSDEVNEESPPLDEQNSAAAAPTMSS
mmetsp:Transcript_10817/g.18437  ORF Transcript_10817/g.18437 Transcript_10817/m.18437 type:complete len:841 (+) Transcript_10817:155-2677(+)